MYFERERGNGECRMWKGCKEWIFKEDGVKVSAECGKGVRSGFLKRTG